MIEPALQNKNSVICTKNHVGRIFSRRASTGMLCGVESDDRSDHRFFKCCVIMHHLKKI